MKLLVVNTGSTSVKLALFRCIDGECLPEQHIELHAPERGEEGALLGRFLESTGAVDAVAHRVVHGGSLFDGPTEITADVEECLEELCALAPLHNPVALRWIRGAAPLLDSRIPQVAVFDTAFYHALPEHSARYALPPELTDRLAIRRYGFHGLAHSAMWERWQSHHGDRRGRVISLQLGGGGSITAIRDGDPVETSMGFSPLEGLVMATRSGDLDPAVLLFLARREGMDLDDIDELLNRRSGLLGLSGETGDMARLLASSSPRAALAIDLYCHRIRKYLGAYMAVLEGVDAILFGGGVGEHSPIIRARVLEGFGWCGIELDTEANDANVGGEGRIDGGQSRVAVWVVPVDEAHVIAEQAYRLVTNR